MNKEKRRVPKLRFPGFTEDWEQRKFKDLFIERREQTIRENEETLLSCAITGIYLNSELFSHFRGSSTIGYLKIKKYDLILSAQNLHLGNANINLSFDKGMISPAYKVFELKSIDPYFINAWVKKDSTKNFFLKATTEGASQCRKNIEWDVLLNQEIPVPNKLEQRTIGRFINNIDMIITLHQRKLEHLILKKKALLQKLFPKNGERYPELRFSEFTDAWEQRKLGDLLILLKDGSHGTHKNTDEGVYLLSAKNIKNGQINIMPDDRIISWEDYDVIHKNYELQFGDILLTIVGSIGETAIYNLKTKVTFQRSVAFLRPSSDLNNGFLYTLINTDSFQNQLQTKQVVSAQPGIYLGDLASIDIIYPKNLSEQEKIYSIFKEIENSITLHQRKLEHLQLQKKALLQQMFV